MMQSEAEHVSDMSTSSVNNISRTMSDNASQVMELRGAYDSVFTEDAEPNFIRTVDHTIGLSSTAISH